MAVELSSARQHKNAREKQLLERRNSYKANWLEKMSVIANNTYHMCMKCKNDRTRGFGAFVVVDAKHSTNFSLNKSCGNRRLKRLCVGLKPNSGIYFLVCSHFSTVFTFRLVICLPPPTPNTLERHKLNTCTGTCPL